MAVARHAVGCRRSRCLERLGSGLLGLHRLHQGKKEVRVYDYVDARVPLLRRMFERRLRGYRAIGYDLVETGDQALWAL